MKDDSSVGTHYTGAKGRRLGAQKSAACAAMHAHDALQPSRADLRGDVRRGGAEYGEGAATERGPIMIGKGTKAGTQLAGFLTLKSSRFAIARNKSAIKRNRFLQPRKPLVSIRRPSGAS